MSSVPHASTMYCSGERAQILGGARARCEHLGRLALHAAVGAAILSLTVACSDTGRRQAWQGSVDTLESGGRHLHNPAVGLWHSDEAWRLDDVLRIGAVDVEGPAQFGRIRDIEVDRLGRIYVLEAQSREVRVFDQAGRHVRSFGRSGAGPGEFRNPTTLAWMADDRLVVVDPGGGRYSLFDTAGAYVGAIRRELQQNWFPWRGAIDRQGQILDWITDRAPGTGETRHMLLRMEAPVARAADSTPGVWASTPRDTFVLALPPIERLEMRLRAVCRRRTFLSDRSSAGGLMVSASRSGRRTRRITGSPK